VENLRLPQPRKSGRFSLAGRLVLIFLVLALAAYFAVPGFPAQSQGYDSLRLFTEALNEISQKYVTPKGEEEMIYGSLRGMMNSLDPDSSFLSPKEYQNFLQGQKTPPAEAGLDLVVKDNLLTVVSVIDGSPAAKAGLRPGDHIIKIGGHLVRNLTTQEAGRRFRGAPGTVVKVQVLRSSQVKPLNMAISLAPLAPGTVTTHYLKDFLAYIRVRYVNEATPQELEAALKSLKRHRPPIKGLVLDLRNSSRGSLEEAVRTGSVFLGDREIVSTKGRSPKTTETFQGKNRDLVFRPPLPMVVLVDGGTARAAEIMAGALRDQAGATLLGAKTMGLCGLTKVMPLEDGSALVMTVAQCYTPKGQKIQNQGLEPEITGKKLKEADEAGLTRPVPLDQDPWVLQAVEILVQGKPRQVAKKAED
jgi:carboxyl-terminal processing protease